MDALPVLARVAKLLERHGLEAVLIGNAAAALQGAPVTTVDLDFLYRRTPANVKKLKAVAADLNAVLMKPYYPVSGLLRISRDEDGLQLDFLGDASFDRVRKASRELRICDTRILIQAFEGFEKAPGPAKATRPVRREECPQAASATRKARLEALKKESDRAERELIRRLLALPMEKRTHFLRKRVGLRMSCI